ncbi:MAG: acyl carrier protein [Actinomycetota bacterium]
MNQQEILAHIQAAATEVLSVNPEAVNEDARFGDDLDADSLDLVELIMALEDRLDIAIPEDELEQVETVGDAVRVVEAKLGAAA